MYIVHLPQCSYIVTKQFAEMGDYLVVIFFLRCYWIDWLVLTCNFTFNGALEDSTFSPVIINFFIYILRASFYRKALLF